VAAYLTGKLKENFFLSLHLERKTQLIEKQIQNISFEKFRFNKLPFWKACYNAFFSYFSRKNLLNCPLGNKAIVFIPLRFRRKVFVSVKVFKPNAFVAF
jgi:hypothetical protein